jgi:hypothetical protein
MTSLKLVSFVWKKIISGVSVITYIVAVSLIDEGNRSTGENHRPVASH